VIPALPFDARAKGDEGRLKTMLRLALPLVAVQIGMMGMGVMDTIMVGHFAANALAAVALGNLYFYALSVFTFGTLTSLDPVVAQAVGAGDSEGVARGIQRGVIIALILSVLTSALLLLAEPAFRLLRQPTGMVPLAAAFAIASIPGTLPLFGFLVLRQSLQAIGRVTPVLVTMLAANILNIFLNWIFIYGHVGFPRMGAVGSAWASSASRGLMCLSLLAIAWKDLRPVLLPIRPESLHWEPLKRMIALGAPLGAQQQLEFSAFGIIAVFMGWLGTVQIAGHQVAINLASLTFMVPLGVGSAAAVLVGRAVGRGDATAARRAARNAVLCGASFMMLSGLVFTLIPERLARLYSDDPSVVRIATLLLPIAGMFQIFDGLQAVAAGVLRGLGDTKAAFYVNLVGFWLIGMPISLYLGFRTPAGPAGLWWGLVAGLVVVSAFLMIRVHSQLNSEVSRVRIDR
jgi:MATE family multidrug resistance protein